MSTLKLSADTLAVSPGAGDIEYNGKILVATPQASTQRGIIPTEQYYRLNTNLTGSNAIGAQNIFGTGVTLEGSTSYEYELVIFMLKTAGTTSHTLTLSFGGTATLTNILSQLVVGDSNAGAPLTNATGTVSISQSATIWTSAAFTTATRTEFFIIKGTASISSGGTFIPQYSLSAAPGGAYTTQAGSYMKIKPIGGSGTISVGTWT